MKSGDREHAEYMRNKYYIKRVRILKLLGGVCAKCGSKKDLEIDHIDVNEKSFNLSKKWSYSEDRLKEELAKCQLLCYTCHKEKHKSQATHGTVQRYWRGCKCDPCRDANTEYNRVYQKTYFKKSILI